jgi:hypothetical protein
VQTVPHAPQLFGSKFVETHALEHIVSPVPQLVVHMPPEQTVPAPQTVLHVPQFALSERRLVQNAPVPAPQTDKPVPHVI